MPDDKICGILENLGLKCLLKFNRENLTADLIPKLSIEDFKTLDITDHGIIMNLRIRC